MSCLSNLYNILKGVDVHTVGPYGFRAVFELELNKTLILVLRYGDTLLRSHQHNLLKPAIKLVDDL